MHDVGSHWDFCTKVFLLFSGLSRIREERTTTPHRKLTGDGSGATVEPVIVYRNGRGTVSPSASFVQRIFLFFYIEKKSLFSELTTNQ